MYNETMYLNYYDLNNVEDLINYVIDRLKVVSEEYLISNSHLWLPNEFPYIQEIDRIEKLIDNCGKNYYLPEGWQECKVWLTGNETEQVIKTFSFEDINRWIINLQLLKASVDTFTFSTFSGSDIIINNLPVNSRFRWFKLKGNTYQQTYSGKNLYNPALVPYTNMKTETGLKLTELWATTVVPTANITNLLEPNTTYTVSCKLKVLSRPSSFGSYNHNRILSLFKTGSEINILQNNLKNTGTINTEYDISQTFTTPADLTDYRIIAYDYKDSNNATTGSIELINLQIEKGSSATSYEPYVGGQTSPNPDYPQKIQSVTGRQVVSIEGKNKFDINGDLYSGTIEKYNNGFTLTKGTNRTLSMNLPKILEAGTYTISSNIITSTLTDINRFIITLRSNSEQVAFLHIDNTGQVSFTLTKSATKLYAYINNDQDNTATITLDNVMISKNGGNYEPYQEPKEYEINLGKNLFGLENKSTTTNSGLTYSIQDNEITINGTSTSAGRLILQELISPINFYSSKKYKISQVSSGTTSNSSFDIQLRTSSSNVYSVTYNELNQTPYNIRNVSNSATHIGLYIANNTTFTNFKLKLQIEEGNEATTYSPYFTPIELNKINEYQDYIDGDVDNWYVNKYTDSVIFNGSESTWGNWSSGTIHRYYIRLSDNNIVGDKGICNYFIRGNHADRSAVGNDLKFFVGIDNNLGVFNFRYDSITTLANFKTWLSTHNTEVLYVLSEPTRTKITNTELISQLNELARNKLLDGYNHITVDGNLPGILNIEYLSNIEDKPTIWNINSNINWNEESDIEWSDV